MISQWKKEFIALIEGIEEEDLEYIANEIKDADLVIFCGNGGSYAAATHMAGDILINTPIHANTIALGDNNVSFTALSNDTHYEEAMSTEIDKRFGNFTGKVVTILLSTSGCSPNIYYAAVSSANLGHTVIAVTGNRELPYNLEDYCRRIKIDSTDAGFIEAVYDFIGHALVRLLCTQHSS